jgi:transcriptional regulator with XRE-family HTH domain
MDIPPTNGEEKGVYIMNTPELQGLKMAWLAAAEAGDTPKQQRLLREHPAERDALIDFIAGYHATIGKELPEEATILPITQRAFQRALDHTFAPQLANLLELRKQCNLSKVEAARGLRMTVDVWSKFESGAIELVSLSHRQLDRLAQFFQVSIDQFALLLEHSSQQNVSINRRQTQQGARSEQQGPQSQSFAEAIARSTMSKEDQQFWLDA